MKPSAAKPAPTSTRKTSSSIAAASKGKGATSPSLPRASAAAATPKVSPSSSSSSSSSAPGRAAAPRPLNRSVSRLSRRVGRLGSVARKKRVDAICDIIDLKGYSLAVLLREMPRLAHDLQILVAQKIEDFLYFHADRGRRLVPRLAAALEACHADCRPHLISALADVKARVGERLSLPQNVLPALIETLSSKTDFARKSKCAELLAEEDGVRQLPLLIATLTQTFPGIDKPEAFQCAETLLFSIKRLAGDGYLRLMIHPQSEGGLAQFKLEWRNRSRDESVAALRALETLEDGAPQVLLGVIDLSAQNVSFIGMIQEGLKHPDKWVRQTATSAMSKVIDRAGFAQITDMLTDPAQEVRMMAVSSLGNFPASQSGEMLERLAGTESESLDVRLNALYALHGQKNVKALKQLTETATGSIALNARGLSCLLMPVGDGLEALVTAFQNSSAAEMHEYSHYLMELAQPADLKTLMKLFAVLKEDDRRAVFVDFLAAFMANKAGPNLDKALETLTASEQRVIEGLQYTRSAPPAGES